MSAVLEQESQVAAVSQIFLLTQRKLFSAVHSPNGVKIQTGDGKLTILEEGKKHKFVKKVTEITFSGVVAGKAGKDVLYVTERAVFALKADGIHLIEVAPGIDVQTQVLDEMDFEPIVDRDADGNVKLMDARIFKDEVMGMTIE